MFAGGNGPGSLSKDLSYVQALYGTAETLIPLAHIPMTEAASKALTEVGYGIGDVIAIVQGFQQGGTLGGLEAGYGADALVKILASLPRLGLGGLGPYALPIGIAIGLAAAFFGGNHDKPENMPDKYDTQNYGQGVANLQGSAGASGQSFVEDPSLVSLFGGRTGIQAVEETLAQYTSAAAAPTWLRPMYSDLESKFGSSTLGNGRLSIGDGGSGRNDNNQQVVGATGVSGQEYQYTQLDVALSQFQAAYAKARADGEAIAMSWESASTPGAPPRPNLIRRHRTKRPITGMRRYASAFSLLLVFLFGAGTAVQAAPDCVPPRRGSDSAVSALVDKINGVGLTEGIARVSPWPTSDGSPFVAWYARFLVALGTDTPPPSDEQRTAATLVASVRSMHGSETSASVWTNSVGTSYTTADAKRVRDLCVTSVKATWPMGPDAPAAVEPLMREWLTHKSQASGTALEDPAGFVSDLSRSATTATKRSNHPFNALIALFLKVRFDRVAAAWPKWTSLPYYDDGSVHGIRLRSSASALSFYLFTAKSDDLLAFGRTFAPVVQGEADPHGADERWKSVKNQFKPSLIALAPLEWRLLGRRLFVPSLDSRSRVLVSFGTTVSTVYNPFTALQQSDLLIQGDHLMFATVAGVEGSDAPKAMTLDIWPRETDPTFGVSSPMIYFVVDDRTGVILADGFRLTP